MVHQNAKNYIEQSILKSMGLVSGVSDMIYLSGNGAVFIEFKSQGGRQTDSQREFEEVVRGLNYQYHLIRSFDEFKALIESLQ